MKRPRNRKPFGPRNPPKGNRVKRLDLFALDASERHYCKSAALVAGATKVLSDFVNGTSWGTDAAIDIAVQLLEEAKGERQEGRRQAEKASNPRRARYGRRRAV